MSLKFLKNKSILITGGTGTVGSALVFKLIQSECRVIRVMSNDENTLYELSNKINGQFLSDSNFFRDMKKNRIRFFLGDVRDFKRCKEITRKVDIVVHAAALKHVGISEYNSSEAMQTNIDGTKNMLKASIKNKVSKFLFISTDKVVSPKNIMGLTKFRAENYVINSKKLISNSKIKVASIRFGNILGSRGSVVPKFINSLKNNNRIFVTHKKMSRFVMSVDQAINSIVKSIRYMQGSEIFIMKSMKCFKIIDLAKSLVKYMNKNKNKIIILNKKGNEKLEEELFTQNEIPFIKSKYNMFIITKKKQEQTDNLTNQLNKFGVSNFNFLSEKEIIKLLRKIKIL